MNGAKMVLVANVMVLLANNTQAGAETSDTLDQALVGLPKVPLLEKVVFETRIARLPFEVLRPARRTDADNPLPFLHRKDMTDTGGQTEGAISRPVPFIV
ncbi:MAG: hypothetical protein A2754_03865 [Candidatus Magasanikbacteria bacterium RIFCSPHIGHO2_01_FULL_47_8]|uniref:Secreted protein n=1 Tax=Candidatus Magasanikbacteria bacterium RIFCSPHIGHO2_01_FULL_47_8 TaxID=1798673 RepID=A0A1F6MCU6_9BACT|nr:MAG: hypothetical protein A2754_03865 [Candidatus Magasanikbacteria bacterium RIFCSPHIGHO2_01_FULL_47_8]